MKSEKGITLVALVLAIIILLIIAAVAVSMVIGPHGIAQTVEKEKESSAKVAAQTDLSSALTSIKESYSSEKTEGEEQATLTSKCTTENLKTLLPSYEFTSVDTSGDSIKVIFTDNTYKYTATVTDSLTISDFKQNNK